MLQSHRAPLIWKLPSLQLNYWICPLTCACCLLMPLCLLGEEGRRWDFHRHLHNILHSTNKQYQEANSLGQLGYTFIVLSRKEYIHIFLVQLGEIILIDCQLVFVPAWRATSLSRYFLSSDLLISLTFAATFLKGWESDTSLFRPHVSELMTFVIFCVWLCQFPVFSLYLFIYYFRIYRIRLGIAGFCFANFQVLFKIGPLLLDVVVHLPSHFLQTGICPCYLILSLLIRCTLTVLKQFHFRERNLQCKSLLLPVLSSTVSTSHRECFALILLPVLMLLIWSLIIPYNKCFSSCVLALILGWLSTRWSCLAATF